MKNKLFRTLFVLAAPCLAAWTAQAQLQRSNSARQVWEYQEIQLSTVNSSLPKFNQLGAQGWYLVSVTVAYPSNPNFMASCEYWAYMKRAKGVG